MSEQDPMGRLKGELRATQQRQARLRYQIRHQVRSLTRLRQEIAEAIGELQAGAVGAAHDRLMEALARSVDVDTEHTPPGAKRKATKRAMNARKPPA